jgi:hypothetical protein
MRPANFKVDTRLASLLGENYRSFEVALKELIDNSWDADADEVKIDLPEPLSEEIIIIEDNGSGMTEKEVRDEYLFIARSRKSRKGSTTPRRKRKVKGRKGIGKFAGLLVAEDMTLTTYARGIKTQLQIDKNEILDWKGDLEKLNLDIVTSGCAVEKTGTTIMLKGLNQNMTTPDPIRLSQLLITEYSRENDFNILINGIPLSITDLKGRSDIGTENLKLSGKVKHTFTISKEKRRLKQPGIAIRVDGKIIGKPTFLGLEEDEEIPKKVLKKVYGEVEVDGLSDDITADWGAVLENSKKMKEVKDYILPIIKKAIQVSYSKEFNLAKARLQKKINKKLEKLPEHKRDFARKALDKVLKSYYNESEDKINTVISVVLDTLEKDEYYEVFEHIDDSSYKEMIEFAEALSQFGILELTSIGVQTKNRLRYLDYLDKLIENNQTLESDIHIAIEKNLWILGENFSLMSSNKSLNTICKDYLDRKFKGKRKDKRPDLLLSQDYKSDILLIELKKPDKVVGRDEEAQANKYRDDMISIFPNSFVSILILGKSVNPKMDSKYKSSLVTFDSYKSMISKARTRLNWLFKELSL